MADEFYYKINEDDYLVPYDNGTSTYPYKFTINYTITSIWYCIKCGNVLKLIKNNLYHCENCNEYYLIKNKVIEIL